MEAVVAVLKPRQVILPGGDFNAKSYEILLMETQVLEQGKIKKMRQLPATNVPLTDEPSDALCSFLYRYTGGENGGLQGKQAVLVPPMKQVKSSKSNSDSGYSSDSRVSVLFCLTVDVKDKLNKEYTSSLPSLPQFYPLDVILENLYSSSVPYLTQTKVMLERLKSWLIDTHCIPGGFQMLFTSPTQPRRSIINPIYVDDPQMDTMTTVPVDYRTDTMSTCLSTSMMRTCITNEEPSLRMLHPAAAAMPASDKCDITKINPLFGSELPYKCKVDRVVVNKYFGMGKPDYSKILRPRSEVIGFETPNNVNVATKDTDWDSCGFMSDTAKREGKRFSHGELIWRSKDYPLHRCAMIGDAEGIKQLIAEGWSVTQKDAGSSAPIHHAAFYGHLSAITMLLNESNCSPNVTNDNGATPLHLAASQGKLYVVELLLTHQDIDVSALDKFNKTALDYCESVDKQDWQAAATLLRVAMSQPVPTIQVSLMDGSYRVLNLVSNVHTTVQQLHHQMMKELKLPDTCSHLFTIWICSKNLQLQLKPDHKPIQHLNDWKRRIVLMLTDQDPSREDPQLFWRRDAILSIEEEKKVKNPVAVNLLYLEAYHNYIKSLYPCADTDAVILAGILMHLYHGEYDAAKTQPYRTDERRLAALIPTSMLETTNSSNWLKNVVDQYRHYSRNMVQRERAPSVLQMHFLTICWNLTAYGSAFFTGYVRIRGNKELKPVYIGVNDVGLHIITVDTKKMWRSFMYKDIEWHLVKRPQEWPMLEVKAKAANKHGSCLHTKQAGLIEHLMNKLAQLNVSNVS